MWPWSKPKETPVDLETRLEKLERTVSLIRLEWSDVQEVLTRRVNKLAKVAQVVRESSPEPESGAPEFSANEQLILGRLPPAQRAAQERILLARKRGNGG